jgi:hypothetical protein
MKMKSKKIRLAALFLMAFFVVMLIVPAAVYASPRTHELTCYEVWVDAKSEFQFSFMYAYADNNWVKIYDMSGKEVFSIDMSYDDPHFVAALPDGVYTVKTFTVGRTDPIQTFTISKGNIAPLTAEQKENAAGKK